jgi:glycerophosphoryl diester phosphodiesterase
VPRAFEVHGHRGARGLYPENTIEGFLAALRYDVDALEGDLLLTADGVVVMHHDAEPNPDIARDEHGQWLAARGAPIKSMTAADLARYDVGRIRPGSDYAARFPHQQGQDGVRIPTLAAALDAIDRASGRHARWNLEIKIETDHPEKTAAPEAATDAALTVLREHGLVGRVMIQSFEWRAVRHVRDVGSSIPTACLTDELDGLGGSAPRLAKDAGCTYWEPKFSTLTIGDLSLAHELGLRVVPWTVNELTDLRRMIDLGVDGVITDYPDRLTQH